MYFEYLLPHNKVTNIPVKQYNFKKTPKQKFPYIFSQYFFGQTFPGNYDLGIKYRDLAIDNRYIHQLSVYQLAPTIACTFNNNSSI